MTRRQSLILSPHARKRALESMMTKVVGLDVEIHIRGKNCFVITTNVMCIDLKKRLENHMFVFQGNPSITEFHDQTDGSFLHIVINGN